MAPQVEATRNAPSDEIEHSMSAKEAVKECCTKSENEVRQMTLPVDHPLTPLSPDEITLAASIVKADVADEDLRFESIELLEPPRELVRSFEPGSELSRAARVVCFIAGKIGAKKYKVCLKTESVIFKEELPTECPMIQREENKAAQEAVKAHPDFIAAMEKRGITDMSLVNVGPWPAGFLASPQEEGRFIVHAFIWIKSSERDNHYAHPVEGINAVIDLKTLEVLEVTDKGVYEVPKEDANYLLEFNEKPRDHLKPINVTQPEGVSFTFENGHINWHDWSLVIGFNNREGLTLHDISFAGRPICYRASIAEMVVPYASTDSAHARKNVFDIGEIGFGRCTNSLKLGCDCLGSIQYLDCWMADTFGDPMKIDSGICIHEEDSGILWKHHCHILKATEVRRARRLVISSVATVGNYDYASYWYFYLDGEIEYEMKATGILNTKGCEPYKGDPNGTEVAPGVVGQNHQHVFCAKLDLSIDGDLTKVVECDTVADPIGPSNPYGNAFYLKETPLTVEGGRKRDVDKERYWKFQSNDKTNRMGKPTAYKLEPSAMRAVFHDPAGKTAKRMGFINNHLWVTPFHEEERYPAGDFVNTNAFGEGLPKFVEQGRSLEGQDVVAWHSFGLHHFARLEDWPVQPCATCGFKLMPIGFFDRNPVLDLAPNVNEASCHADAL